MYDRLPIGMMDDTETEDSSICKGRCFVLSGTNQVLGLLLEETDSEYVIGYPSKCYLGEDEDGHSDFEVVSYTKLPYIAVLKNNCTVAIPVHAESEHLYYEYLVNNITSNQDFSDLLTKHGFDSDTSSEYYVRRHIQVKEYCGEEVEELSADVSVTSENIVH